MHVSYQIIIQVLQLAYTTQACILNLKLMQCKQAHEYAHIKCKQPSLWACSPYLCASFVHEFWSFSILQYCSLFVHVQLLLLPMMHFISLFQLLPFVVNFYKRCASYWYKGLHWGRWLTLESCIFYGHHHKCWNDSTCSPWDHSCRIFDHDTNRWGTPSMSYHGSST